MWCRMNVVQRNVRIYSETTPGELATTSHPARKWPISYQSIEFVAPLCDAFIILATGIVSGAIYNFSMIGELTDPTRHAGAAAVITALFVSLMKSRELYVPSELLALKTQIKNVAIVWATVFLFLASVAFALKIGATFSRGTTVVFGITGLGTLIAERLLWHHLLKGGLAGRKFSGRSAVLITDGDTTRRSALVELLTRHGYSLRNCFILPDPRFKSRREDEITRQIVAYVRGSDIEEVVVSTDLNHWSGLDRLFSALRILPLPVRFIPVGAASDILKRPSHMVGEAICFELHRGPLNMMERAAKRTLDVLGAGLGLFLLLPLFMITAIAIKFDSPGPILFRQRRCGFNGKPFQIVKFRTMSVLEDGDTIRQAKRGDDRVTRVGRWLRHTSIDELPQLWNVLQGSMSLIGPRPHAIAHDNQFEKIARNYAFRHHVKPGLTGWAQVNGCRGPTPTAADVRRRVELDLWYIDHWSFGLDFVILLRTFVELIRGNNAY